MFYANFLIKEKKMITHVPEKSLEEKKLEDEFGLAFKLVFYDENDRELEPPKYKILSTFGVEKDSVLPT